MSLSVAQTAAIRFGYGIRPGETPVDGVDGLVAQLGEALRTPAQFPMDGLAVRRRDIANFSKAMRQVRRAERDGKDMAAQRKELRQKLQAQLRRDERARLAQSVLSPYGFHERLAAFWLNHFSVNTGKSEDSAVLVPLFDAEAIRPNLAGRFADLLQAVSLHPAMLIYLDQVLSIGPNSPRGRKKGGSANENFARELLELHTLGVDGGYTQFDVQQTALALTGLELNDDKSGAVFDPQRAEPGQFMILGKPLHRGGNGWGGIEPLFVRLSRHHSTSSHICRKLVTHFIDDGGDDDLVEAMTKRWRDTDGNLTEVYRVMLQSPRAWSGDVQKVKMPFDYVVSVLRALGVDRKQLLNAPPQTKNDKGKDRPDLATVSINALNTMGQPTWQPPAPAGFDDASAYWLNPTQLAARIVFVNHAVSFLAEQPDPRAFAQLILGERARADTIKVASQAPSRKAATIMALAAPEFHRR